MLCSHTTSEQLAEDEPTPTTSKSKKGTSGKKRSRKKPAAEIAQSATEGSSMIVDPAPVVISAQVAPSAITCTALEANATQTTLLTAEGFGCFLADMGTITPSPNNTQERNVDEVTQPAAKTVADSPRPPDYSLVVYLTPIPPSSVSSPTLDRPPNSVVQREAAVPSPSSTTGPSSSHMSIHPMGPACLAEPRLALLEMVNLLHFEPMATRFYSKWSKHQIRRTYSALQISLIELTGDQLMDEIQRDLLIAARQAEAVSASLRRVATRLSNCGELFAQSIARDGGEGSCA
ncbi:hypothetical protein BC834DRAFT_847307 [Gloeopeniophorella convolvens]|nr:hypothetical protein BC834DRAFT_847307 [Gloeopeniophorella convolvens]